MSKKEDFIGKWYNSSVIFHEKLRTTEWKGKQKQKFESELNEVINEAIIKYSQFLLLRIEGEKAKINN